MKRLPIHDKIIWAIEVETFRVKGMLKDWKCKK